MALENGKEHLRCASSTKSGSGQRSPGHVEPDRQERISVAAYYNAQRRGFERGGEVDDWLEAERQIDHDLPGGQSNPSALSHLSEEARRERESIRGRDRPSPLDSGLPGEPDHPPLSRRKTRAA